MVDILAKGRREDKHGQLGIWDARAPAEEVDEEDDADSDQREAGRYWRLQVHWPATSQSSISCIKFDPIDAHSVSRRKQFLAPIHLHLHSQRYIRVRTTLPFARCPSPPVSRARFLLWTKCLSQAWTSPPRAMRCGCRTPRDGSRI